MFFYPFPQSSHFVTYDPVVDLQRAQMKIKHVLPPSSELRPVLCRSDISVFHREKRELRSASCTEDRLAFSRARLKKYGMC